jgi:hypothetical protein
MTLHLYAPFASAANMTSCLIPNFVGGTGSTCDEYDSNDDMTPFQQDWIEGTYDFTLRDTSTIDLELVWALREFNLEALGFNEIAGVGVGLANDGLGPNAGAPADLIRSFFDLNIPGTPKTFREKLITEIDKSIEESIESGFGTPESNTGYTDSYTNAGTTIACSTDPSTDAFDEGALLNNVFEPPICLRSVITIAISQDSFNLVASDDLDLERAYEGLLVQGAEITTMFDLTGLPGHKSSYSFNPPSYATIKSVDANGTRAARAGPPAYFAGEWEIDNRNAGVSDGNLGLPIEVEMMHRNRSDTNTVTIPANEKALDFQIQLDLRDETAVTLEFVVALHYLDEATMTDWGISMMSVAERATMNQVTSDGIRLAYHNGIVDLSNITSQFPVDTIAEGVSSTVANTEAIVMNEMEWVSDSIAEGMAGPAGGLNFTHQGTSGCTELAAPNASLNYCLNGPSAMSYEHPIYLRTTSEPFSMRFLDIVKENNNNALVEEILNVLSDLEFNRIMESGLEIETTLNSSFLSAIIPSNLPPSELTLEIILPSGLQTKQGSDRIILKDSLYGNDQMNLSFASTFPYDWRHVIKNEENEVICLSTQTTCISSDVDIDAASLDFNEWDRSVTFEFGLNASVAIHRLGIPEELIPAFGEQSVSMAVIPSDLLRHGIDLSSRLDSPIERSIDLSFLCELNPDEPLDLPICDEFIYFVFTRQGLQFFVERVGVVLTSFVHQMVEHMTSNSEYNFETVDLEAFEIQTNLNGLEWYFIDGIESLSQKITDQKGISLSLVIPTVKFKLAVDGEFGKMLSGDFDSSELSLTTNALRQTLLWPMVSMLQSFSGVLVNGVFSMSGITSPSNDDSLDPYTFPVTFDTVALINNLLKGDFDMAMNGPMTILLPEGIKLVDLESSSGYIVEGEVDGRQEITYNVPYGEFEDTVTFRIQISWYFFFLILWKYMIIMVILSYLGVRRFKKKRAQKRSRRNYSKARVADKVSINPNEFADLSGFHSQGIHGEMESLKDYSEEALPPLPPVSAFGISAVQHVDLGEELFD